MASTNIFSVSSDYFELIVKYGEDVILNGSNTISAIFSSYNNDKYHAYTLAAVTVGDLLTRGGSTYIIVDVKGTYGLKKAICRWCNKTIKFNLGTATVPAIKSIPAVVDNGYFDTAVSKYVTNPEGRVYLTMRETTDTSKIDTNYRFISMGSAWKVAGIDRTKNGILTIRAEVDVFKSGDDRINEVAVNSGGGGSVW